MIVNFVPPDQEKLCPMPQHSDSLFELHNVRKTHDQHGQGLKSVSLTVAKNERLAVVGETGSGKSTLLKCIAGLVQPDEGTILFRGQNIPGPADKLIPGHEDIAYLSQHFELPKFISVFEHLDDPFLISPEEADEIYRACRIEHLLDRNTAALSGGEKQRVALAKLLLRKPEVLLLDEPFSNLDFIHMKVIKEVLDSVEDDLGINIILVNHDPRDSLAWAEWIIVLRNGELVQKGDPKEMYYRPNSTYVAGLFGLFSLVDSHEWDIPISKHHHILDGRLFIRPENLKFGSFGSGRKGEVTSVLFQGFFDEISISMYSGEQIVGCSPTGKFRRGERIGVTVAL